MKNAIEEAVEKFNMDKETIDAIYLRVDELIYGMK